jgi:hypothetical protein
MTTTNAFVSPTLVSGRASAEVDLAEWLYGRVKVSEPPKADSVILVPLNRALQGAEHG